jgi:carotenoid cleavage dioxygenase
MPIIRSFLPWLIFFVLSSFNHAWVGAFAAVICYIIVYGKKVTHLKVLDRFSSVFFLVSAFIMLFLSPIWYVKNLEYFSNGFLALFILYTILIQKPFTIEYAKESTPASKWNSTEFYKINNTISLAWFLYFSLCIPFVLLSREVSPLFRVGQGVMAILAVCITEYYPKWYLKK